MQVRSLGREDPLEEGMATHSSILAWRIPWTEESGGLQSMGLQRVRHNLETEYTGTLWIGRLLCAGHYADARDSVVKQLSVKLPKTERGNQL